MAAKELPTQFPAIVTRESENLADINNNVRTLVRSIEELRRTFVDAINNHAGLLNHITFGDDPVLIVDGDNDTDGFMFRNLAGNNRVKLRIDSGGNGKIIFRDSSENEVSILVGTGDPEGTKVATPGSLFLRSDGGAGESLYSKESGTGSTGWVAK